MDMLQVEDENGMTYFLVNQSMPSGSNCENGATEFVWTRNTTLLLISEFSKRKDQFRDPKIKKKLWGEIKDEFVRHNHPVSEESLDRKWRNLKKTYSTIKDNKRKTGRGRIGWEFFDLFEEIFNEDRTMNPPVVIQAGVAVKEDVLLDPVQEAEAMQVSDAGDALMEAPTPTREISRQSNTEKAIRNKALYNFQKKQLDIEAQKVEEIKLLRKAVERSNEIQERRNAILEKLVEKK